MGNKKPAEAGRGETIYFHYRLYFEDHEKGFEIFVPGIVSGNRETLRSEFLICRTEDETLSSPNVGRLTRDSNITGFLNSVVTIRIGSTRSESLDRTAAASKRADHASLIR